MNLKDTWIIKQVKGNGNYNLHTVLEAEKLKADNTRMLFGLLCCLPVVALAYFQGWWYLMFVLLAYPFGCVLFGHSTEAKYLKMIEDVKIQKSKGAYCVEVLHDLQEKHKAQSESTYAMNTVDEIVKLCEVARKLAYEVIDVIPEDVEEAMSMFALMAKKQNEQEIKQYFSGDGQEHFKKLLPWLVKLSDKPEPKSNPLNAEDDWHDKNHNPDGGYKW